MTTLDVRNDVEVEPELEMLERLHTSQTSATSYQDKMTFIPISGNLAHRNPQKMELRTPQACEEENLL